MRGLALLLCLAALSVAADEPAPDLEALARAALDAADYVTARKHLEAIIAKAEPPARARAMLDLAMTYPATRSGLELRKRGLRQVSNEYPGSWAARVARVLYGAVAGARPARPIRSDLPSDVLPGKSIPVMRKSGGTSYYRIERVDPDAWHEAWLEAWLEAEYEDLPLVPSYFAKPHGEDSVRFWSDSSTVTGDFTRPGLYVLYEQAEGHETTHRVRVGVTALVSKALLDDAFCYAFDVRTGQPLPGFAFVLRTPQGDRKLETDAGGLVRFPCPEVGYVVARRGDEVLAFGLESDGAKPERALVHIATDRPVYRPGQLVHYKATRRLVKRHVLALGPPGRVRVEVRDPQGRILQEREHAWSELGTVTGSFRLADRPATGKYHVFVHVPRDPRDGEMPWWAWEEEDPPAVWTQPFEVQAYRKPEFRLSVELPPDATVGAGKVRARIRAEYFHGGPVAGAELHYVVERAWWQETERAGLRPPWRDPLAWFPKLYDEDPGDFWYDADVTDTTMDGEGGTDADGILEIEFPVDPGEGRAVYEVWASASDESDQGVNAHGRVEVRRAAVVVEVGADRMFFEEGRPGRVFVRVRDAAGRPRAGHVVALKAFLNAPARSENHWEFESFLEQTLTTGADGTASLALAPPRSGRLRVRGRAADDAGRVATDRADWWVAGARAAQAWDPNDTAAGLIEVVPERHVYRPGETMRFLVLSPAAPLHAVLTVESDMFHDVRALRLTERSQVIELTAAPAHAPAVTVKLAGHTDRGGVAGGFEVFVYPEASHLDVSVETDRTAYAPREEATVTVRAAPGAEIELGIVDEAIFDVAPDDVTPLLPFFFRIGNVWPALAGVGADLGDSWESLRMRLFEEAEAPLFGGQAEEEPVSPFAVAPPGVASAATRHRFPDTMHWSGRVVAGADGRAVVKVETPDSLTRWRVVARAVAGADRFGEARSELVTRKNVVVRPAAPRFLAEGDEATIGAIVHNNLDAAQDFVVRCEAEGLEVEGSEHSVTIPAGGKRRLDWTVRAREVGEARLRVAAYARDESDLVEIVLPVRTRDVLRRDRAGGRVDGTWRATLTGAGELEVVVATPGQAVRQALPYLARYPYGCVEQTMSRFLPAVVAYGALEKGDAFAQEIPAMVDAGLQRLYRFQHEDGGWGWWETDATDPRMTAYVVAGLCRAKRAGFAIDPKTLRDGVAALEEMEPTAYRAYALSLAGVETEPVAPRILADRAYLVLAGHHALADNLAFGEMRTGPEGVTDVALIVRALHAADPKDPRLPQLVDWLLRRRRGASWYSTLDTAYVVMALVELGLDRTAADAKVTVNGETVPLEGGRALVPATARSEVVVTADPGAYASAELRTFGPPRAGGAAPFTIRRRLERDGKPLAPDAVVERGDRLTLVLTIDVAEPCEYVMAHAPLPAGAEPGGLPVDADFDDFGHRALLDDHVELAAAGLGKGRHVATVHLHATTAGTFRAPPAQIFAMYDPDKEAFSGPLPLRVR